MTKYWPPFVVFLALASMAAVAAPAEADECVGACFDGHPIDVNFGLYLGSMQRPPGIGGLGTRDSYVQNATSGGSYQQRFNLPFGVDFGLSMHPVKYLALPMIGLRVGGTIGPSFNETVPAGADTYHLHLANGFQGELMLPGVGLRLPLDPVLIEATVQPTLAWNVATGEVVRDGFTNDVVGSGGSLGVDGKVSACWLQQSDGPSLYTCFYAAPLGPRFEHEEHALLNGILFGLEVRVIGKGGS